MPRGAEPRGSPRPGRGAVVDRAEGLGPADGLGPGEGMAGARSRRRRCGAVVGLVVLYAVLLQAFLTNAAPSGFLEAAGILCSDHGGGGPSDDPPGHPDHACCTLVHAATMVPPTSIASDAPPPRRLAVLVRRPEAAIPRTGPPTHAHRARGPPPA